MALRNSVFTGRHCKCILTCKSTLGWLTNIFEEGRPVIEYTGRTVLQEKDSAWEFELLVIGPAQHRV